MIKRTNESPTKQEEIIIKMYEKEKLSCFQIAQTLKLDPYSAYRVIEYWCDKEATYFDKILNEPKKEIDMAKGDKNKTERSKDMAKLREGDAVYGLEMDKMRGMLSELEDGECFIVIKQGTQKDKVNLRLGDVAYS